MSSSFHNADKRTHRKIMLVGLLFCAAFVAFSFFAREQPDNSYVLIKADKLVRMILDYAVLFIIILGFFIASWISAFAIGVKRLHDRNKSGWLIVLFYAVPSILGGIANTSEQAVASFVLGLGSLVISIWGLVELGFLRGTVGPNAYGPDPLQTPAAAPASIAPASAGP